jgi:tRNA A37 N6-isopentenylltransferase MiaA
VKRKCKNSLTPSKAQCASKENVQYIQQNNNRKFPKFREIYSHKCKGPTEHETDQTKIEIPHSILSLKQQIQRPKKEY